METIRARRLSVGTPVVLPLVLVVVGVVIVRHTLVFGAVWLAIFGAFLVVGLVPTLLPASVSLTPEALLVRGTAGTRSYAWADCGDFHVWEEGKRSTVAFGYAGPEKGQLSDRDARRAQADRALPVLPGVSGHEVLARITAFRAAPTG